ncbi:hypothetical protein VPH35_121580 [Triticum aestivum]
MAAVRPNPSRRLASRRTGTPVKHSTAAVVSSISMLQPAVTTRSHNDMHCMITYRFRRPRISRRRGGHVRARRSGLGEDQGGVEIWVEVVRERMETVKGNQNHR